MSCNERKIGSACMFKLYCLVLDGSLRYQLFQVTLVEMRKTRQLVQVILFCIRGYFEISVL